MGNAATAELAEGRLDGVIVSSLQSLTGRTIAVIEDNGGRRALAIGEGKRWVKGEPVSLTGAWGPGVGAGRCLRVSAQRAVVPRDVAGAASQLMRGLHLDFAAATKLLSVFGSDIFEILDAGQSERLAEAGYSGPEVRQFIENWKTFRSREAAQTLLERLGINEAQRKALITALGVDGDLDAALRENPYVAVIHVPGVDWVLADRLGDELGLPRDSADRRNAALLAALRNSAESGHTYLPVSVLQWAAGRLLGATPAQAEWDGSFQFLRSRRLVAFDGDRAYLPEAFEQSAGAARAVIDSSTKSSLNDPPEEFAATEGAIGTTDFRLPRSHFDALGPALGRALSVVHVAGADAAVHLAESFVRICGALRFVPVVITPTHWAARALLQRLPNERIGTAGALLGVNAQGDAQYENIANLRPDAVLVVGAEQLSMQALTLLLTRRPDGCALILSGDPNQDVGMVRGRPYLDLARADTTTLSQLSVQTLPDAIGRDSPLGGMLKLQHAPQLVPALAGRFDLPIAVLESADPSTAVVRYAAEVVPKLGLGPSWRLVCVTPTRDSLPRALHAARSLRRVLNPTHADSLTAVGKTQLAINDPFLISHDLLDPTFIPAGTPMRLVTATDKRGPIAAELDGQRVLIGGERVNQISQAYVTMAYQMLWQRADVVVVAIPQGGDVPNGARVLYSMASAAGRKLVLLGAAGDVQKMLSAEKKPPYSLFELLLADLRRQRADGA